MGISKGNLAFHFHSKEHLLAELVKELRQEKFTKVLSMDYRNIGSNLLREFCDYVKEKNAKELEEAAK